MSLLEQVSEALAPSGFDISADGDVLSFPVTGDNGEWTVILHVFEGERMIVVYSVLPVAVPQELRERLAVLLADLNFGIALGNFELSLQTGELRFKTSAVVPSGLTADQELLKPLLMANLGRMDLHLPDIEAAARG